MNELTFVARLSTETARWYERKADEGERPVIASGDIEERQVDASGHIRRCDIRLSTRGGRKIASGEMKRPEVPEGRDPRSESLVSDARNKAIARGLPFYFTCNMSRVVLYETALRPREPDREVGEFLLAHIRHSGAVEPSWPQIADGWCRFLDELDRRLQALQNTAPEVTSTDVLRLRNAINAAADEAVLRVENRIREYPDVAVAVREQAAQAFDFNPALRPEFPPAFRAEVTQLLRFGIFVVAQKLILYRVLQETGPRRSPPFNLDSIDLPRSSTDPDLIRTVLDRAWGHAIERSGDFETALLLSPLSDIVFAQPITPEERIECRVGELWANIAKAVATVSWATISRNLVGFLYEMIIEPEFRHTLGQFYTPEGVVDLLTTFAVREPGDRVLDPASGGGGFLWAAYRRKRAIGDLHEMALENIWAFEITAFAAELSTITLATADTNEPAAYPRVVLSDFFDIRPGALTELAVPDRIGNLRIPEEFDAIIGNPPYISYRRITNQAKISNALASMRSEIALPKFSGKTDAYAWFIVHATQFLRVGGRLAFVVSSAILFSDYGIPLIRFIGRYYKIVAVVDSMVERWFAEADTNAVMLFLEREVDRTEREQNVIRFVRLRRPLAQLLPPADSEERRGSVEDLISVITADQIESSDPRLAVHLVHQGAHGGLTFANTTPEDMKEDISDDD